MIAGFGCPLMGGETIGPSRPIVLARGGLGGSIPTDCPGGRLIMGGLTMVGAPGVGAPGSAGFASTQSEAWKKSRQSISSVRVSKPSFRAISGPSGTPAGPARPAREASARCPCSTAISSSGSIRSPIAGSGSTIHWASIRWSCRARHRCRCRRASSTRCGPCATHRQALRDAGARDDSARDEARTDEPAAIEARHMNARNAGMLKGVEELDERDRLRVLFDILRRPQPQGFAGGVR